MILIALAQCGPAVERGDEVTFTHLPEQIRKHYWKHSTEYSTTEFSTWTFLHVWLRKDPEQHLLPQAVLQFSVEPRKLWIDCWEKMDGDWFLIHSNALLDT
jgi:hypothetical protein